MKRLLAVAVLASPLAAFAAGPAHAPGSAASAKREAAYVCPKGNDAACCHCEKDCAQPAARQLPGDLSDMIEEHFLSVQAKQPPPPG